MLKLLIYSFFFLVIGLNISKGQEEKHALDKKYEKCLESNGYYYFSCLNESLKDWDMQLNTDYQLLKSQLSPDHFNMLKTSQLVWIQYRDKEYKFIDENYKGVDGTMYPDARLREKIAIVRHRALELEAYINMIEK